MMNADGILEQQLQTIKVNKKTRFYFLMIVFFSCLAKS
jgi:hypothetical protein